MTEHQISTAFEKGQGNLKNGELIQKAEEEGFEVFITTDQNLRYQQNLQHRSIAIIVLLSTSWPKIQRNILEVVQAVHSVTLGSYLEVEIIDKRENSN